MFNLVARFHRSNGSLGPGRHAANRATILIMLGIWSFDDAEEWSKDRHSSAARPNPKLLRNFLGHQFNGIDVLEPFSAMADIGIT